MKSHVVFGAGLIGCFLGGALKAKGLNVSLLCRPNIQAKLANGLKLSDYLNHQVQVSSFNFVDPKALIEPNETGFIADFLWLTVKCTCLERAAQDMFPLVGPDTVILCCQNGLDSDKVIRQRYPDNLVLRVMVPFNVVEISDGHFHRGSEGNLTLETSVQNSEITETLVKDIHSSLMPLSQTRDMNALLWAKLQLNLGNSVNALADIPVKEMLEQRAYRLVIAALMHECLSVTDALGIDLPKVTALPAHWIPGVLSLPNFLFKLLANKMLAIDPRVRTSMWWDLSQGKATEIDYLNGAVLAAAATSQTHLSCPVNEKILELVKSISRDGPNALPRPVSAKLLLTLIKQP
jgi:2-dehydropantoate 2-reductase